MTDPSDQKPQPEEGSPEPVEIIPSGVEAKSEPDLAGEIEKAVHPDQAVADDANPPGGSTNSPDSPARPSPGQRIGAWFIPRVGLFSGLLALIIVRSLFIHGDPSDFPRDRNFSTAGRIKTLVEGHSLHTVGAEDLSRLFATPDYMPEFPFLILAGWFAAGLGIDPITGARLFSLLCAILSGWGLCILGRRMGPAWLGPLALWIYALLPFSVFTGRCLLPEAPATTAIIWSLVGAGAGRRDAGPWAVLHMTLWLIVAGLAKLPAVLFAPAAAIALMQALGWRRTAAWIGVVFSAIVTYCVLCLWYGIEPASPWAGLEAMSASTNNLLRSREGFTLDESFKVFLSRITLVWTLPGLLLGLIGWGFLQKRGAAGGWLNILVLCSVVFVWQTLNANTYWNALIIPAGCLLAAIGIAGVLKTNRMNIIGLTVILVIAFYFDPGVERVSKYLAIHPVYKEAADAAERLMENDRVLYQGITPNDLFYYTGKRGPSLSEIGRAEARRQIDQGQLDYFLAMHPRLEDFVYDLFTSKPILENRAEAYALFNTSQTATLGHSTDDFPEVNLDANLGGGIRIVDLVTSPSQAAPGERMIMDVTFEHGSIYKGPTPLAVFFRHKRLGRRIPLPAVVHGGVFRPWPLPVLQPPDFDQGPLIKMLYEFEISPHMPAGDYAAIFIHYDDEKGKAVYALDTKPLDLQTKIVAPRPLDQTPLKIDPRHCLWLGRNVIYDVTWTGRPQRVMHLNKFGQFWIRPNLPPGDYDLVMSVTAEATGPTADQRWPVLAVRKPKAEESFKLHCRSAHKHQLRHPFHWNGPQDILDIKLDQPRKHPGKRRSFPLYYDDLTGGKHNVLIYEIRIEETKTRPEDINGEPAQSEESKEGK